MTSGTDWIRDETGGARMNVKVIPRGGTDRVEGPHGDALKIRLNAPPVDGKANAALIRFLADQLDLPVSAIAILRGETGRNKTLRLAGRTAADVRARLGK